MTFPDLIVDFLYTTSPWWLVATDSPHTVGTDLRSVFIGIEHLSELNERVFWKQINAFRQQYTREPDKRVRALRSVVYFYLYIIRNFPELKLFEDARTLYPALLENRSFVTEWLENNCSFLTYSPGMHYDGHEQYLFIIRGASRESVKMKDVDYKRVDLSSIHSPFYRGCVFEYTVSNINRLINYTPSSLTMGLNVISELKQKEEYINKSERYIRLSEIRLLIDSIRSKYKEERFRTCKSIFKSFLQWCVANGTIKVDNNVFDEFKDMPGKPRPSKTMRPEVQHLDLLLDASKKKVEQDASYLVFDSILRLALTTKLRVSEICGLKRDCFLPQMKPNSIRINYISKTSHGDTNTTTPLTLREKGLLDKVMQLNEPLVAKAPLGYNNFIFLYIPKRKQYVRVVDKFSFRLYLKQLCQENNIPQIRAVQLRKEYQSQVSSYVRKTNLNDAEYKALSGHAHIDTTETYYAKTRIEEYFEEFFMIQLHDQEISVRDRVVKSVPAKLERVGDTTHKCGACNASDCVIMNALPCFVCKDFITSREFLPVFRRMVEDVDSRIIGSNNLHDKEDLTVIKEILVQYIIELTKVS